MGAVIEVNNLGKLYRLGKIGTGTLSHDLKRWWSITAKGEDPYAKIGSVNDRTKAAVNNEHVWALKDVSFKINSGEVVGIIGKNGAGKSTLLKILSRITSPSVGEVKMRGRVGSLLEVGTGFHPEMTGRENIFMNGTVLGMRRFEIQRKFDEIVEFAGVAKYIDTPVKRYSSGMMVRLGFAVAAFLEPEILIVDEVLAVGDAEFQRKCMGKMQDVASDGRTILFVSHNLAAVRSLCNRGILIANGSVQKIGDIDTVASYYVRKGEADGSSFYSIDNTSLNKSVIQDFEITQIALRKEAGDSSVLFTGEKVIIAISYKAKARFASPAFVLKFKDHYDNEIIRLSNMPIGGYVIDRFDGDGIVELVIDSLPLVGGEYFVDLGLAHEKIQWHFNCENLITLRVEPTDYYNSGLAMDRTRGLIVVDHSWEHKTFSTKA